MQITKLGLLFFLVNLIYLAPAYSANLTDQVTGQIDAGAAKAGFGEAKDPRQVITEVIQIALGFVGTFFTVLILMSAYWYVTARGDEQKIEKATKTIRSAIIGLIIVLMAYSITRFVSSRVLKSTKKITPADCEIGALGERRCPD